MSGTDERKGLPFGLKIISWSFVYFASLIFLVLMATDFKYRQTEFSPGRLSDTIWYNVIILSIVVLLLLVAWALWRAKRWARIVSVIFAFLLVPVMPVVSLFGAFAGSITAFYYEAGVLAEVIRETANIAALGSLIAIPLALYCAGYLLFSKKARDFFE